MDRPGSQDRSRSTSAAPRSRDGRRPARWVLLAGANLLGVLLGLELAVRLLGLGPQLSVVYAENFAPSDDPHLGYALKPGSRDGEDVISSAGLRDREYSVEKPPGVFRIAAIGDSITYGHGYARAESWPEQLELALERAALPGAPRYQVLNFGVTGYNIRQIARSLEARALAYHPDLVIYGYALNDPQEYSFEAEMLAHLRRAQQRWWLGETLHGAHGVLARSRLYVLLRALWTRGGETGELVEVRLDPGFVAEARGRRDRYFRGLHERPASRQRLEEGLARLASAARDGGVPVLVALFPLFPKEEGEYPLADVHALLAQRVRAHGLGFVDLQPVFARARALLARPLNGDMLHPNPIGQRVAALALARTLAERYALPVDLGELADAPPTPQPPPTGPAAAASTRP